MNFTIYCPFCETKVTAYTFLGVDELKRALESNKEIQVGHLTDAGDHQWNLVDDEKESLWNFTSGDLSAGA
jgi:hypothetical protein